MEDLAEKYASLRSAVEVLERIKSAEALTSPEYLQAARKGFREIKQILLSCNHAPTKGMLQQRLSCAFYHMKKAEELARLKEETRTRVFSVPAKAISSDAIGPIKKTRAKPRSSTLSTNIPKNKRKKRSVWTISGGGIETSRRHH